MVRISNTVLAILNFFTLVVACFALREALLIQSNGSRSDCEKLLHTPLLIMGIVFFVVSLLGLVGSCSKDTCFIGIYMAVMMLFILGLVGFTIFGFVITSKGEGGKSIAGKGFKEYRLGDYSYWLQKYVSNGNNWDKIKSCFNEAESCRSFGNNDKPLTSEADFYKMNLSPIQSSCCIPPVQCGFQFTNGTVWTVPKSGPAVQDSDCTAWSNDQKKLCYDCKSCQAGIIAQVQVDWKKISILNGCITLFLLIIYSIAYCSYRNNSHLKYTRYPAGYPPYA